MYVQEGYSLSCDALTKVVKVTKDPLEVDLSRNRAQNIWTFQRDILTLTIHKESDSLHLERVRGLRFIGCLNYRWFKTPN